MDEFFEILYLALVIFSGFIAYAGIFGSDISQETAYQYVTLGVGIFFFFITFLLIFIYFKFMN